MKVGAKDFDLFEYTFNGPLLSSSVLHSIDLNKSNIQEIMNETFARKFNTDCFNLQKD